MGDANPPAVKAKDKQADGAANGKDSSKGKLQETGKEAAKGSPRSAEDLKPQNPAQALTEETLLESPAAIAHLLRRAGFGADPEQWEALSQGSYDDAVTAVMNELKRPPSAEPSTFDPYQPGSIQQLWLERMVRTRGGVAEKLTLFWHGHFATSEAKIKDPELMWKQYTLLRSQGSGPFRDLLMGISKDPAMIRWLDGNANRKGTANENYARELQELFTLGIGNYTETDVREIARAFTGWGSRHHDFVFRKHFHDTGEKTVHGKKGNWTGEDVIRIVTNLPACARYIARELLKFYSHPSPNEAEVAALAGVLTKNDMRIDAALEHLFRDPAFRSTRRVRCLVRGPVDFMVSALRCSDLRSVPPWVHGALDRMGQILFRPPSVKGWTSGTGWLSAGAVVERLRSAERIAQAAPLTAVDAIPVIAFDGKLPEALAAATQRADGKARVATMLGSPDYQLK